MTDFYVLNGHEAVPTDDRLAWARMLEDKMARSVAQSDEGDAHISTMFLGLDHQYGDGPPLLFETMIFGGEHDQATWRYTTWEEAVAGHEHAVKVAQGEAPIDA